MTGESARSSRSTASFKVSTVHVIETSYAVVGVGPVAYLLGQAVVLLVGSAGPETAPGKAGAAFAASTLGNVAGGLAIAILVSQHLGVAGAGR